MIDETRNAIHGMTAQAISPYKIAMILGLSSFSVRYVIDHKGERAKSHARVKRWRERHGAAQ